MAENSSFRPLSWGLSFNVRTQKRTWYACHVFVPFLGDFLSIVMTLAYGAKQFGFSSPFLGTFFQLSWNSILSTCRMTVFVPFLGDFLSILQKWKWRRLEIETVFVPFLGDFLSMNWKGVQRHWQKKFSSPFLGTFFQFSSITALSTKPSRAVFVPFLGDFLSITTENERLTVT